MGKIKCTQNEVYINEIYLLFVYIETNWKILKNTII